MNSLSKKIDKSVIGIVIFIQKIKRSKRKDPYQKLAINNDKKRSLICESSLNIDI